MNPTPLKSNIYLAIAGGIVAIWVGTIIFGLAMLYKHSKEPAATANLVYHSPQVGLDFSYPPAYSLTSRRDSYQGADIHVLTFINASTSVPDMSEGPTSIAVIHVPVKEGENVHLEDWVRNNSISNFNLSSDKIFTSTTVDGEPALAYRHSGLYEFDAVAVKHGGHIYLFSASWMDEGDRIRTDFKDLLASVTFIE